MYFVSKRIEVAFAHQLNLTYSSPCTRLHGHNALVTVYCCSETLNENGMVVDFKQISQVVKDLLDHQLVNEQVTVNPTAENLARILCERIPHCYKVSFRESEDNTAVYVKDDALAFP